MSTFRISVICNPFWPGAVRTSRLAPGGTVLLPLRSTTLTWRKASPPVASSTKPKPFSGLYPEHLSVYQTSPELWEREAFEEKLDGAPEATGEPGKSSAGEFGRLAVRAFFSAWAGLLAWSHMLVETAQ